MNDEQQKDSAPVPNKHEHLLLMFIAAAGVLFFMVNLRGGQVRQFFDYFSPGSIIYWLGFVYNMSMLLAPIFIVLGSVKMSNHPEKGWYLLFSGSAFHAFTSIVYLIRLPLTVTLDSFSFYSVVQVTATALCITSLLWLLSKRVLRLPEKRTAMLTAALTFTWITLVIIYLRVKNF